MKRFENILLATLTANLALVLGLLLTNGSQNAEARGEGAQLSANETESHSMDLNDSNKVHIYQLNAYANREILGLEDTLLFFDKERTHAKEDTPKAEEERFLNSILMASLMDELY